MEYILIYIYIHIYLYLYIKNATKLWSRKLKEKDHLVDLNLDDKILKS